MLSSLVAIVAMSFFRKESRMTPTKIFNALAKTGYNCVMVVGACATAGIVIGVVLLTGMGGKITSLVIALSAGSLFLALPIVMLASILFGMGLPTVVCYVLLAATVAPSLIDLGVTPMAAHLVHLLFWDALHGHATGLFRRLCRCGNSQGGSHENRLDGLDFRLCRFFAALYVRL